MAVTEPWQFIALPVNVTWINYNPQDPYFKRALKRSARTKASPTAVYQHTWELLERYNDIFVPPQYYDQAAGDIETLFNEHVSNHANPHVVTAQQVAALPLSGGQMIGPVLARPANVDQFQLEEFIPKKVIDSVQAVITDQIQQILSLIGTGRDSHTHTQASPSLSWIFEHALDTDNMMVQVFGEDGTLVLPANINFIDQNNMELVFITAEAGKAHVFKAA